MALAATQNLAPQCLAGQTVVAASARGTWAVAVVDAKGTAQSATELKTPLSVTSSNIRPIVLGPTGSCVVIRGRYNVDATGGTHAGIIRVYAVYGEPSSTGTWASGTRFVRIDGAGASSQYTLTVDRTNDVRDGTYCYTEPVTVSGSSIIDARGAHAVLVLTQTASDVSGGSSSFADVEVMVV